MNASAFILYDHIIMDLDSFSLKIEWNFINALLKFKNNINKGFETVINVNRFKYLEEKKYKFMFDDLPKS